MATTPGKLYEVLLDQAANPDLGARVCQMVVQAAGQPSQYAFDCTGLSRSNMGWATRTWQFRTADTTTTLEFYSPRTADRWKGPALDNVVVALIREPATIALLGIGGVGLLRKRGAQKDKKRKPKEF